MDELKQIKDICEGKKCYMCPLLDSDGDSDDDCLIIGRYPDEWDINKILELLWHYSELKKQNKAF